MFLIINLNLDWITNYGIGKFESPSYFLQGDYDDFSAGWYMNVGTKIIMTMIIELPIPHFWPMTMLTYFKCARAWDRSCTKDRRKSKKILQEDYEDLYIGPEFVLDYRLG